MCMNLPIGPGRPIRLTVKQWSGSVLGPHQWRCRPTWPPQEPGRQGVWTLAMGGKKHTRPSRDVTPQHLAVGSIGQIAARARSPRGRRGGQPLKLGWLCGFSTLYRWLFAGRTAGSVISKTSKPFWMSLE
jgi:hypothetical protein